MLKPKYMVATVSSAQCGVDVLLIASDEEKPAENGEMLKHRELIHDTRHRK